MYKQIPTKSTVFSRSLCLILMTVFLPLTGLLAQQTANTIPGEFVVKVRPGNQCQKDLSQGQTGIPTLDNALAEFPVHRIKHFCPQTADSDPRGLTRVLEISTDEDIDPNQLLSSLQSLSIVEYAEPKYLRTTTYYPGPHRGKFSPVGNDELPDDPYYPLQWMLPYINVPAAWDIVTGDPSVVIANVDIGVDIDHPDLAQILWQNPLEYQGSSGMDDDGNGWTDDIYGWDFVDNDPDPRPITGDYHGTHTSGIAIASTNNGIGGAGIARDCRLMSVRVGIGSEIYFGFPGIYYAAHSGAKIISLSWGGYGFSQFEQDVVEDAQALGCLIVAAAGNESTTSEHYPAAYDAVIAVAAIDQTGQIANFSNYGIWVDIAAPGVSIYSTIPNGQWGYASGTSMAAPVVAGVSALVASLYPDFNSQQLMSAVIASGNPIDDVNPFYGNLLGTGCVNAFRAVDGGRGGLSIDSLYYDDTIGGDGDGIPEPGETIRLSIWLHNQLADETQVIGEIIEDMPGLTLTNAQSNFGSILTGEIVNNTTNPFEFALDMGVSKDQDVRLALELRDQNDRRLRRIPILFVVSPSFGDHNIGNTVLTITEFGSFGYVEYLEHLAPQYFEPWGSGFKYPKDGLSSLYHGSWMIGTNENHVSDNAYGDQTFNRRDFHVLTGGELTFSSPGVSDQDGIAIFNDQIATNPMGIEVTQHSYAWASPPNDDYVIVAATAENTTNQTLSSLYIGLYMDWDIGPYLQNLGGWSEQSEYVWMTNQVFPPSPWIGMARVNGDPASVRVIDNAQVVYTQRFPDNIKYQYLSEGIIIENGESEGDWSLLISAGPFTLSPGQSAQAAFAIGAGDTQEDLAQNMDAARTQYSQTITNPIRKPNPEVASWELLPFYPNPYNDWGRIQLLSRQEGIVSINLYNILGQKICTVYHGMVKEGLRTFDINSTDLSSGIYYCRLDAPGLNVVQRVVLIR